MGLSESDVARILKLIDDSEFDEVRVEFGDLKIYVRRGGGSAGALLDPPAAHTFAGSAAHATPVAEAPHPCAPPSRGTIPEGCVAVRSPMVGIFYRAPSPGAPPFVEIGNRVEAQDVVCIVEVMKLFNSVNAGTRGTVREIVVADGAVVEYGQPLIIIESS